MSTIIRNEKDVYKIVFLGCYKLLLPNTVTATAISYLYHYEHFFHRCTANNNENSSPDGSLTKRNILLISVIFLACKTTENLRTIRDIFNCIYSVITADITVDILNEEYIKYKHDIIVQEHEILRILGFNLTIDLPHKYLLNIARYLNLKQYQLHMAWNLLNDVYVSKDIIHKNAGLIAICCLELAIEIARRKGYMDNLNHINNNNLNSNFYQNQLDNLTCRNNNIGAIENNTVSLHIWYEFGFTKDEILTNMNWILTNCLNYL